MKKSGKSKRKTTAQIAASKRNLVKARAAAKKGLRHPKSQGSSKRSWHRAALTVKQAHRQNAKIKAITDARKRLDISNPKRNMHSPTNVRLLSRMNKNVKLMLGDTIY